VIGVIFLVYAGTLEKSNDFAPSGSGLRSSCVAKRGVTFICETYSVSLRTSSKVCWTGSGVKKPDVGRCVESYSDMASSCTNVLCQRYMAKYFSSSSTCCHSDVLNR